MKIEARTRVVYFAPTANRHYMTKSAAIKSEARAMINKKYPMEKESRDEYGRIEHEGWYWLQDERLCKVYERLVRRLTRRPQASIPKPSY